MKQVAQNYKTGELTVLDVPAPACRPGGVLVRSLYSLISTGTEVMKVTEANMSLVGKARPARTRCASSLDTVAQQGPRSDVHQGDEPARLVHAARLLALRSRRRGRRAGPRSSRSARSSPALATSSRCMPRSTGCPVNLCVPVPDGVEPQLAAFATVGAIAMQGVRRAEPQLGDSACVVGLGLVGQLVVQLLVAAGVRVVGLDVVPDRCRLAEKAGAVACDAPDAGRPRPDRACARRADRRHRCGPRPPGRRRPVERPGRGGGPFGPGPGPDRRHRQAQARPAVERLLRQGARRPLLPVVRSRPLRRRLRARGPRLPRRLRPVDRAAEPRSASSTCSPARRCRSTCSSPSRSRSTEAADVYGRLAAGELHGVGFLFEYPKPDGDGDAERASDGRRLGHCRHAGPSGVPGRPPGHRRRRAARRLHRCRQLRVVDAPAAPGRAGATSRSRTS